MPLYELEQGSTIQSSNNNTIFQATTFTLSTIGIGLSALALFLLLLTATLFHEWRKSYKNQLLIQFMLARCFYSFLRYINDIQFMFENVKTLQQLLTVDVFLFIYTEITLVGWMFVFSRQIYMSLVKVFDPKNASIWKVSICAWIIPLVISYVLYLLYYVQRERSPIRFVVSIMIIKWPALIVNAVLLIIVLRSVLTNNMNTKNNVKIIVVMLVMIFVFCFQQMFIDIYRLISINSENMSSTPLLSSNILTLYQCAFSILFWLFGNENTRKLWKCQRKELRGKTTLNLRFSA